MEFMAYFAFLLLMFTAFGPIFFNQAVRIERMKTELKADRIATLVEREVNVAVRFSDGYRRNFTLPSEISGEDYTVRIIPDLRLLEVDWGEGRTTRQLTGKDFSGSLRPGENRIRNLDGEIVFN